MSRKVLPLAITIYRQASLMAICDYCGGTYRGGRYGMERTGIARVSATTEDELSSSILFTYRGQPVGVNDAEAFTAWNRLAA
jgi:hypothetical protein